MKATKEVLIFICISLFHGNIATPKEHKDSVKVSVFYESYCDGCVYLFLHQIYKTWQEFKNHMVLDLAPYGNTDLIQRGEHVEFDCQHGPRECRADLLHACAIHQACAGQGTSTCPPGNLGRAMDYIKCTMEHADQAAASDRCASHTRLQSNLINDCANGTQGLTLKLAYARRTLPWRQRPDFPGTPFVIFNEEYKQQDEEMIFKDLRSVVCKYIPKQC